MNKNIFNEDTHCEEQSFFHPSDDRTKFCAALCESTNRQCHNQAVIFNPYANLVIPLKYECATMCFLCKIHQNIAIRRAFNLFPYIFEKIISSSLDLEEYLFISSLMNGEFVDGVNSTAVPNVTFPYESLKAITYNINKHLPFKK